MSKIIAITLLAALPFVAQSAPVRGSYGDIELQQNFDVTRYMGRWFEIYRTKNAPFQDPDGTDGAAWYELSADGTVAVRNTQWIPSINDWDAVDGVVKQVEGAKLTVQFSPFQPPGDYRVLWTDYDEIAVVYSKSSRFGPQQAWILGRKVDISQDKIDKAFQIFEDRVQMEDDDFHKTEHGVASSPRPSYLRASHGDVALQPDFQAEDYLGKWYEIYRSKNMWFESGTDSSATYALNQDGDVSVTNKEWIEARNEWNVALGNAKIVGNAQLEVKFNPLQPAADYRVLYTDYDGISVVYSKTYKNAPPFGWLLARDNTITDAQLKKAFDEFARVGLEISDFHKTQHGVALLPEP